GFGPAFQAEGAHVTVTRLDAAGQCRVLDRARRKRRSLAAHVVEEMEPGESLDKGPRHLVRPAGLDFPGHELPGLIPGKPGEVLVPGVGPAPLLRRGGARRRRRGAHEARAPAAGA